MFVFSYNDLAGLMLPLGNLVSTLSASSITKIVDIAGIVIGCIMYSARTNGFSRFSGLKKFRKKYPFTIAKFLLSENSFTNSMYLIRLDDLTAHHLCVQFNLI